MPLQGRLTLAEAEARYGIKRNTLARAILDGRLVGRKVAAGKRMPWLVTPAAVERFLGTVRRSPAVPAPDDTP